MWRSRTSNTIAPSIASTADQAQRARRAFTNAPSVIITVPTVMRSSSGSSVSRVCFAAISASGGGIAEGAEDHSREQEEEVVGPEDHADRREDRIHGVLREHPNEDRELAHESVQTRDGRRSERAEDEEEREQRQAVPQAADLPH